MQTPARRGWLRTNRVKARTRRGCGCAVRSILSLLLFAVVWHHTGSGWAQLSIPNQLPRIFDPTGRSGEPRPLEQEKPLEPARPPVLREPPIPPEFQPSTPLPSIQVFVRAIHIVGSTVFTSDELDAVTQPYLNRSLSTEDFERLRLDLTFLYIKKGYVTSGATIPDQDVTTGEVTIQIVEGKLTTIDIEGNSWVRAFYFRNRIDLGVSTPVNIERLQERFQFLQQDPRVERLNAELRPGVQRGDSELHVKVKETRLVHAWLDANNYQTPLVGAERILGTVVHQSLTGFGDTLSFTYGRSNGMDPIIDTFYSMPLNAYETLLTFSYRRNDFLVVESPYQPLDIRSQSEIFGVTLSQPIYRTLNQQFTLSVTGEYLHNKTFLLGEPFDFIPGTQNGVANVAAIRIAPEWVYRTQASVLAARSRFSIGIDALDATINSGPVADGQFFSWLGQVQAVHRLEHWWGTQLLGRFDIQLANDHLFPLEQAFVGGRFTVRGYRENTLIRDNAMVGSLEARVPIWRNIRGEDVVQIAPFVDYGSAWNNKVETPFPRYLASVGVGLRWNILPQDRARFEVYWGLPLNHFGTNGTNLQDYGIHMQLVVQAF